MLRSKTAKTSPCFSRRDTIGHILAPGRACGSAGSPAARGETLGSRRLPQFAGLKGDGENSATAVLVAMQPLQEAAARYNLAVVMVRHERKSGGEVGDAGRGSTAFAGAADIVVSIRRAEGNSRPTIRELMLLAGSMRPPTSWSSN